MITRLARHCTDHVPTMDCHIVESGPLRRPPDVALCPSPCGSSISSSSAASPSPVLADGPARAAASPISNDEARSRLSGIADVFLAHDRPIARPADDSVVRVSRGRESVLRRARGYAPDPLPLPAGVPPMLATGAELKNTFCITNRDYAFLSHHIGDMENYETLRSFEAAVSHFERLFRAAPRTLAHDLHPDYLSTRYALSRAAATTTTPRMPRSRTLIR